MKDTDRNRSGRENDTAPSPETTSYMSERTTQRMTTRDTVWPRLHQLSKELINLANTLRQEHRETSDEEEAANAPRIADLLEELGQLAENVSLIDSKRTVDTDFCLGCIAEFLRSTVTRNADQLAQFNKGVHDALRDQSKSKTPPPCQFSFEPTAAALSSVPLCEHMKGLGKGGRYDVVSDLASWRDGQLKNFSRETELAVERGVWVRRIFNLKLPRFKPVTKKQMRRILEDHLGQSEAWNAKYQGAYEVAIFGKPNFASLEKVDPAIAEHEFGIKSHFGIFVQEGESQTVVEYEVTEPNVSNMILKKDEATIRKHLETFRVVWELAPKLNQIIGSKSVLETVLENPRKWTA